MATSKAIQGALAMTAPLSAEDQALLYQKMDGALSGLIQTPEERRKDELLAWGGGLTDPSGNGSLGGALINANKSLSEQRTKDRELRAQYAPLIVGQIQQQMQQKQLANLMQNFGDGAGGFKFAGMPPEALMRLNMLTGRDNRELWEVANFGKSQQGGNWITMPDGQTRYLPSGKDDVTFDTSGAAVPIPNMANIKANAAELEAFSKARGEKRFATTKGVTPEGVEYDIPMPKAYPEMFAGGNGPQGGGQPQAPARAGTPAQPRNPGPAARPGLGGAPVRGSFVGSSEQVMADIDAANVPPAVKEEMRRAYAAQVSGNNPPFDPMGTGALPPDASSAPPVAIAGAAPAASNTTGLPEGAIQTGIAPQRKEALRQQEESNTLFRKEFFTPALQAADNASETLAQVAASRTALRNLGDTGWGEGAKETATKILSAMGVPEAKDKAASYEMFQYTASRKLWEELAKQKGPQTEGDAQRMAKTYASIQNTPKGNAFILDMTEALAWRAKQKGDYFRKVEPFAIKNGDMSEIGRRWDKVAPSIFDAPSMRRWKESK